MDQPQHLDIGQFEFIARDVALPMGLTINALTLTGADVHLESDPLHLSSPTPGKLKALVFAENLASFLNSQSPGGLRDFKVELKEGRIHVQASIMIMKASAVCTLRIQDGEALYVDLESVDVLGVGAKNLVQAQLDKINPVMKMSDLPIEAELTDWTIEDGKLILEGDVHPRLR